MAWPPNVELPEKAFLKLQVWKVIAVSEIPEPRDERLEDFDEKTQALFNTYESAVNWAELYTYDWLKDDDEFRQIETVVDPHEKGAVIRGIYEGEDNEWMTYSMFTKVEPATVEIYE